jgi:glycosyltransferase involved in cell wall biosynthesis
MTLADAKTGVRVNLAVCTIAYNEVEWIQGCIRQFRPFVARHVVLVSSKPWFGEAGKDDGTAEAARKECAEVHVQHWHSEAEQRNWGLAQVKDFDYVFIVDADELYTRSGIEAMVASLRGSREFYFRIREMRTYWKTTDYIFAPIDSWDKPVVAVDPKRVRFYKQRQVENVSGAPLPAASTLPATLHHMSWVRSDEKVREKIRSRSYAPHIRPEWYEKVWLQWTPEMRDVAPYTRMEMQAVYCPRPALDD